MPLVALLVVGVAAGFLASRILKVNMDTPSTIALGVLGALIGTLVLRGLVMLAGIGVGFVGAVLGALVLIRVWKSLAR